MKKKSNLDGDYIMKEIFKDFKYNVLILVAFFTSLLFIYSTYAWFSSTLDVDITFFKLTAGTNTGLSFSLDGVNWSNSITLSKEAILDNLRTTYPNNTNQWSSSLPTVSSVGIYNGNRDKFTFVGGKYTSTDFISSTPYYYINSYYLNEDRQSSDNKFIAFDLFFRNISNSPSPDNLYLSKTTSFIDSSLNDNIATFFNLKGFVDNHAGGEIAFRGKKYDDKECKLIVRLPTNKCLYIESCNIVEGPDGIPEIEFLASNMEREYSKISLQQIWNSIKESKEIQTIIAMSSLNQFLNQYSKKPSNVNGNLTENFGIEYKDANLIITPDINSVKLVESIKNQEYNLTIQLNNIGEFSSIIQLNSSSKESDNVLTKRLRDTKSIIDNNEYFEDKIFNYAADGIKAEPNGNNRQILDVINSNF